MLVKEISNLIIQKCNITFVTWMIEVVSLIGLQLELDTLNLSPFL